jgi:hypothetical protein
MKRTIPAVLVTMFLLAAPAFAADDEKSVGEATDSVVFSTAPPVVHGPALPVLYGTLAALQAYDGWSTVKALRLGAVEANPALTSVASNPGAMLALKAGATTVSIYAAERMWRRHRHVEAVVTMVVVNGMMATVAAHNASVARGLK